MKTWFYLFFAFLTFSNSFGQTSGKGSVKIQSDSRLDSLIERQIWINQQKKTIPGYRIQIYFGGQRTKANEIKADFLQKFPEENAYLLYQQPNFKIRVGDFKDRFKAQEFYLKVLPEFSSAFIVRDEIYLPEIK